MREQDTQDPSWKGHPLQAALIRALALALPIAASVAATVALSRLFPPPDATARLIGWWVILGVVGMGVCLLVDRQARRLLPLAALLKLSLVFPDQAPSRFGVALRSGTVRQLERRVAAARSEGLSDDPTQAATTVLELVGALNIHDRRTRGHSERVRALADLLADELNLETPDRERLRWAALLHDVGKLAVPHAILTKPGRPTEEEWEALRSHPLEGEKIAAPLSAWLGEWAMAIGQHHEQWDGTGYPRGLRGEGIARAARIVSVADSFEVMTAVRTYKRSMPAEAAREELARCAGTQFDPVVVRAFLNIGLGKLRLGIGPLSWLAQQPFLGQVPLAPVASGIVGVVAAIGAVALGAFVTPPSPPNGLLSADFPSSRPEASDPGEEDEPNPAPGSASRPAVPQESGLTELLPPTEPSPAPASPPDVNLPPEPADGNARPRGLPEPPPPVPAVNDPPVATDDRATTAEDTPVVVPVLANDTDADGDTLSIVGLGTPSSGTVSDNGDGTVTYNPAPGVSGTATFDYTVGDGAGGTDTATVTVDVTPVGGTSYYLGTLGGGDTASTPVLPLSTSFPSSGPLANYDTDRDSSAGLQVTKTGIGLDETDPTKYQSWSTPLSNALVLAGPTRLDLWAAMKNFDVTQQGTVVAGLLNCDAAGQNCITLATGNALVDQGASGGTWQPVTIDLGDLAVIVPSLRTLVVKVVVDNSSGDDMWFAYGTASYPSALAVTSLGRP